MDGILGQLPALGGVGLGGTLVFVIIYLLRSNYADRAQHREMVTALRAAHKEDLDEAAKKVDRLEARIDEAETEVDQERDARRLAQDTQADAERRATVAESRAAALRALLEGRQYVVDTPTARVTVSSPSSTTELGPGPPRAGADDSRDRRGRGRPVGDGDGDQARADDRGSHDE